jgi:uncharacterized DUF497 family protein
VSEQFNNIEELIVCGYGCEIVLEDWEKWPKKKMKRQLIETDNNDIPYKDTPQAWFEKDESGPESEDVHIGDFIWNRKESNENITDVGGGKGFSFYYARYVFNDENSKTFYNETNPENEKTVGMVTKDKVMVVIDTLTEGNLIRIISAWEVDDSSIWARRYHQNKKHKRESIKIEAKRIKTLIDNYWVDKGNL